MRHHLFIGALAFAAGLVPVRADAQLASAASEALARTLQKVEGAAEVDAAESATRHPAAQVRSSFAELQRVIKPRQKIVLTDVTGRRTTGKLADLSDTSIALDVRRNRVRFDVADVRRIERVADRFWDATVIGTGVGAGIGGVLEIIERRKERRTIRQTHGIVLKMHGLGLMLGTMIGAAAGAISEAVVDGREVVYVRPGGATRRITRRQ